MSIQHLNSEEIFAQAIMLPVEERESFVSKQCSGDVGMAHGVIELLRSHMKNEAEDFIFILDRPPVAGLRETASFAEIAETAGDVIGRFKLLQKIGEGGMGVVYMAKQVEGVKRPVALKIIKLGMDTRQVIARFEAERQAMALFDHPNITKVLDAGATLTGRPYFVMELVKGTSITEYASSHKLSLSQRLNLFVSVCRAVQHAHQKGIIHRDLKPSNILVTLHDGVPVPKVIDFGIAKAIGQQRLTEKTLFTRYSAMVGTPQYMSPEQAELNGLDVDTRSDIYSLGVLLYELVTGTTPICNDDLKQVSPLALHETLRDAEIETPSMRIQGDAPGTGIDLGKASASASHAFGELDWVVMKALSRDRSERYASANELASDVLRYQSNEAVMAAPPSRVRKLRAYIRRNGRSLLIAAAISTVLLATSIACLVFAFQASTANRELATSNRQLSTNVEQLQKAESQIREAAEQQKFDSAISVAMVKFEMDFVPTIYELGEKWYPEYFGDAVEGVAGVEGDLSRLAEASEPESGHEIQSVEFCFDFDKQILLDLPHKELLVTPLKRIQDKLTEEKTFFERIYNDQESRPDHQLEQAGSRDDYTGHDHSPECLRLQERTNEQLATSRHKFYRHLLKQYRKTFGENDPNVAEALNLLAVALIERDESSEAEARLREAIAIGDLQSQATSKRLLARIGDAGNPRRRR